MVEYKAVATTDLVVPPLSSAQKGVVRSAVSDFRARMNVERSKAIVDLTHHLGFLSPEQAALLWEFAEEGLL